MFDFIFSWLQGPIHSKQAKDARQGFSAFLGFPTTPKYADADGPPTERPDALPASPDAIIDIEASTDADGDTDTESEDEGTTILTQPGDL